MNSPFFKVLVAVAANAALATILWLPMAAAQNSIQVVDIDLAKTTVEVPLLLAGLDVSKKDGREITEAMVRRTKAWDEAFLGEIGLKGVVGQTTVYGEAVSGVDVVRTIYTGVVVPFETRQSVWVWSVWIPVAGALQSVNAETVVKTLETAGLVRLARLQKTYEEGETQCFGFEGTEWIGKPADRIEMVVHKGGILLWRLKLPKDENGNNSPTPTIISSQLITNRGWFSSMGKPK